MTDYTGGYAEEGRTGLAQFSGYIFEDFLKEWHGQQAVRRANEMRLNSPIVGALLNAIEQSIRKVTWDWKSELGESDERLKILEACWLRMQGGWDNHVIEALTFLPFGFALFEPIYENVDGMVIWRKLAPRGQDSVLHWDFDPEDLQTLTGFTQMAAPRYEIKFIPAEKLILYRSRVEKNNPEGRSILRTCWLPYYYAKNIMQIEAIGIERDLAGLPTVMLPQGANTDATDSNSDVSKAAKLVRNLRRDEQMGVVLPFGWDLKLLSTGGSRQIDTNQVIQRYESRILMSSMAQFLMLGQNGRGGSESLSKDQTDLFAVSVGAIADIISDVIEHQALPVLMKLNGYDSSGLHLTHTPAGDIDITSIADGLQKLAPYITFMPDDQSWLRHLLNMPDIDPERLEQMEQEQPGMAAPKEKPLSIEAAGMVDATNATLGAEMFKSAIPFDRPGEWHRTRLENDWAKKIKSFLSGQQKRIVNAVRNSDNFEADEIERDDSENRNRREIESLRAKVDRLTVQPQPQPVTIINASDTLKSTFEAMQNDTQKLIQQNITEQRAEMKDVEAVLRGLADMAKVLTQTATRPIEVNIPKQAAPVVNVTIPEQKAPNVTVNVPEQKAPVVNVAPAQVTIQPPAEKAGRVVVERDSNGKIKGMRKE